MPANGPSRELDVRLAVCLGWRWLKLRFRVVFVSPETASQCDPKSLLTEYEGGKVDDFVPAYSSDSAPRSLLDGVEARIKELGSCDQYCARIADMRSHEACERNCEECSEWMLATAPAWVRAVAAVEVLEGAK